MANAGRLRHRVAVQAATESRDAHGQAIETWATVSNRWARIEPLSTSEIFAAQQAESRVTMRITMRYYPGLTTQHRVLYGTRIFHLVHVPDAGISQPMMELLAIEDA